MSLNNIYDIAGSSLSAQTLRLNTVASNMANAESVGETPGQAYKARRPVFSELLDQEMNSAGSKVSISEVMESTAEPLMRYEPDNPLANDEGYVFYPDINLVEEMADMMSATRSYQTSVEVMNNARRMHERLLSLGQ
ncbi:flagellar basal body rod protein FlgC [Endozoicomonas sp. (ex Bugula neritina AB1)]|nr:flagellar basal body rod protein FlgC [Endozoicomonas sp. (ex Bugula neritina AB1)]